MPANRQAIDLVHRAVNRSLRYMTDQAQYGLADHWVTEPRSGWGDCEDYALTKRARLLTHGAAPADLRIVLGTNWRGQSHAVLYARDDRGQWWVLDNESSRIVRAGRHSFRPVPSGIYAAPA
jgi:predicted transglutaminase-like cysteine proteinase